MDIQCEATGKEVYATQYHAERALEELRRKFGVGKTGVWTLMAYRCRECGFWHLGRPWRKQREARSVRTGQGGVRRGTWQDVSSQEHTV